MRPTVRSVPPALRSAAAEAPAETPFFLLDRAALRHAYRAVRRALPHAELFYAVKANPHPAVLQTFAALGAGVEIASAGELALALGAGVAPHDVISSNPVKTPDLLRAAHAAGVDRFAVDSDAELLKLATHAPGSRVYARIQVDNTGSDWPLSRKFGAAPDDVLPLLRRAQQLGLRPYGLTFHVGSQCRNVANWRAALLTCAELWQRAERAGLHLEMLNLGGGLPVQHLKPIPALDEIGARVEQIVAEHFPAHVQLAIEPGRGLVGASAVLVATVIGKAVRGDERWIYLDAGVFNGLMETIAGFEYEILTDRVGPTSPCVLAGPSCDSVDVVSNRVELPDLEVGDRVYVMNAGAYTLSYASHFNGFAPPSVHVVDGLDPALPLPLAAAAT